MFTVAIDCASIKLAGVYLAVRKLPRRPPSPARTLETRGWACEQNTARSETGAHLERGPTPRSILVLAARARVALREGDTRARSTAAYHILTIMSLTYDRCSSSSWVKRIEKNLKKRPAPRSP